jgi:hypothetical protein
MMNTARRPLASLRALGVSASLGLATCAVIFSATDARAQAVAGTIIGEVVDGETAENVAGVTVTATGPALQGTVTAVTDDAGRFRLDGLPVGLYTLTFEKEGFSAEPIADIRMHAGVTLRYDAVVYKASSKLAASDTVKVYAGAPIVDVGSTQTGGTLNADIARRVPLVAPSARGGAQRSFEAAAAVLPQVQADSYGASINGATSVENQYVLDGVGVNNIGYGYLGSPLTLEFIDEVSVVTGGYLPEYGRSMGGVMNVTTKSGGNELHGSVWAGAAPGFLEGQRKLAPNAGSAIRVEPKLNYTGDLGFELGGPVLHDTLWFYVGAALNQQSLKLTRKLFRADGSEIEGTSQDFFAEATGAQAIAKLTWLADANNRVSFTLLATPMFSGGNGKLALDLTTGRAETDSFEGSYNALAHINKSGAIDTTVKWESSLLERKLRLNTSLSYHREDSALQGLPSDGSQIGDTTGLASVPRVFFRRSRPGPYSIAHFETLPANAGCDDPDTDNATLCPVTTYQFGGPDYLDQQVGQSYQLRQVTTYNTEMMGLHVFKAGGEAGYATFDNLRAYSGGNRFKDNSSGTLFTDNRQFGFLTAPDEAVLLDRFGWVTSQLWVAAFLQDSWTIADMVTLNLGVRYDGNWMYAGDGLNAIAMPFQLSPRAGVIVDPFQSGRVKIYGSFARYYEAMSNDIADRSGSSEPQLLSGRPAALCDPRDPKQYEFNKGACYDDANRVALNDVDSPSQKWIVTSQGRTAIDPNLQPASSDEIVVGAEAEVFRDARVAVSYTRRWIGCPWTGAEGIGDGMLCSKSIEDMSRDEANTYFIGNPGFGIANDFDIAQRNYDALTLLFHKQWSEGWLGQASYTLSSLTGNYAGLFRPETEQLDPNVNSDFDLRSLTVNRNGPLPFDRTHSLKVFGAKEFETAYDTKFTLGGAASATSGGPSNYLGSHPVYGGDEVFILPRGSGARLDPVFTADAHVGFTFKPFKAQAVELTMDIFNLFNFQAATRVDETFTDEDVNPLQNCVKGVRDSCTTKDLGKLQLTDGSAYDPASNNPNFGQPELFQAPRTVRLALRWSF